MMSSSKRFSTGLILACLVMQTASGCARKLLPTAPDAASAPSLTQPSTPGGGGSLTPAPGTTYPGDSDGDMKTDMPALPDPQSFPDPPPASQNPTTPGMTAFEGKAVAHTRYFNLPIPPYVRGIFCYINLTWQPVPGTKEFWIYKGGVLPTKEAANRASAYKVVSAGVLGGGSFTDGTAPPPLSGGNFLDKIKKLGSALTIRPGVKQSYKVIAVDENGTPFAETTVVDSTPMAPAAPPVLKPVMDDQTVKPLFTWSDMIPEGQEADPTSEPDGYYMAVFPSFGGTQGATMPGAVAGWATYRDKRVKLARYGDENISLPPYPGTLPFTVALPLRLGQTYSWTVISVKTDTGNMMTAKAVSKSWGMIQNFTLGAGASSNGSTGSTSGSTSGGSTSSTDGSSSGSTGTGVSVGQAVKTASSIWDKFKSILGK
ncbi:MAG: hypothetical protein H7338_13590 [Candidatus Sericytochromatia bacterium]|nr:hypothetical protein [Candidatus Sericytochromatia bacterium]